MSTETEELFTAGEIAQKLKTSSKTILEWFHSGLIPAEVAEGQIYRFDLAKVRAALAERAKKGAAK